GRRRDVLHACAGAVLPRRRANGGNVGNGAVPPAHWRVRVLACGAGPLGGAAGRRAGTARTTRATETALRRVDHRRRYRGRRRTRDRHSRGRGEGGSSVGRKHEPHELTRERMSEQSRQVTKYIFITGGVVSSLGKG